MFFTSDIWTAAKTRDGSSGDVKELCEEENCQHGRPVSAKYTDWLGAELWILAGRKSAGYLSCCDGRQHRTVCLTCWLEIKVRMGAKCGGNWDVDVATPASLRRLYCILRCWLFSLGLHGLGLPREQRSQYLVLVHTWVDFNIKLRISTVNYYSALMKVL